VTVLGRLDSMYRRTGANLPRSDPLPSHGAEMEGYFWRVTDTARQRVLVVLCGVNQHPDGDWATVAIAAHPGGFVRAAVLDRAAAAPDRFFVTAGADVCAERNWGSGFQNAGGGARPKASGRAVGRAPDDARGVQSHLSHVWHRNDEPPAVARVSCCRAGRI